MAHIRKKDRGSYLASWKDRDGRKVEVATGKFDFEGAQKKANQMEAEAKFWEAQEDGVWQLYANMNFSPKFCHESFTHAKHMRLEVFKSKLAEAEVTFAKASQFRDGPKRKPGGKKHLWRGKRLTLGEIIERTGAQITEATVRWRLGKGWSIDKAVNYPVMSRAAAGSLGANKTNASRAEERRRG